MTFTNPQLTDAQLPDVDMVNFESVDSRYPRIVAAIAVAYVLVIAGGLLLGSAVADPDELVVPSVQLLVTAFVFILIALPSYCFFRAASNRYAVRAHDLILKHGVFQHTEIVQPLIRLQHVEMERGPIDKWAGLAKLKLFSAGAQRETFTIPGLPARTAVRIRRYVLNAQRARD